MFNLLRSLGDKSHTPLSDCRRPSKNMNQRAVTEAISQLQAKGDVFTRQLIIEQRRVDDISNVSAFRLLRQDHKHG